MITQTILKETVQYDEETGVFIWRYTRGKATKGKVAGSFDFYGYKRIFIFGKKYFSHRLAWIYVYGNWPIGQIDHINGERTDNRICNLREATNQQNKENMKKCRSDSTTGILGVRKVGNKFSSVIRSNGKDIYLGVFETKEQAHEAYINKKKEIHPFFVENAA